MASQELSDPDTARGTKRKVILRNSNTPKTMATTLENTVAGTADGEELNDDKIDETLEAQRIEVEDVEDRDELSTYTTDPEKDDIESSPPSPGLRSPPPSSSLLLPVAANQVNGPLSTVQGATVSPAFPGAHPLPIFNGFHLAPAASGATPLPTIKAPSLSTSIPNKWIRYQFKLRGAGEAYHGGSRFVGEILPYIENVESNVDRKLRRQQNLDDLEDEQDLRDLGYSEDQINALDGSDVSVEAAEINPEPRQTHTFPLPTTSIEAVGEAFATMEILESILSKLPAREVFRFEQVCRQFKPIIRSSRKLQGKLFFYAFYSTLDITPQKPANDPSGSIQSKKRLHARKIHDLPMKIKLGARNTHGGDLLNDIKASPSSDDDDVVLTINPLLFNTKGGLLKNVTLTTETLQAGDRYVLQFRTKSHLGSWLRSDKTTCASALITDPPLQSLAGFITGFRESIANHGKRTKKSASPDTEDEEAEEQVKIEKKGKGKGKAATLDDIEIPPGTKRTTFAESVQIKTGGGVTLGAVFAKALECVTKNENCGARPGQEIVFDLYFPVGVEVLNDAF